MYRGLMTTVIREALGSAAFFAAYEISKSKPFNRIWTWIRHERFAKGAFS